MLFNLFLITLKNCSVEPPFRAPYFISVCLLKSSAFSMGVCKRCTVRKAAKLAVYEEIKIKVKKAQTQLTNLIEGDLGFMSVPRMINYINKMH